MAFEVIRQAPDDNEFTPLEEHQTQTPGSFFGGKPVLHHYEPHTLLLVSKDYIDENLSPAFAAFLVSNSDITNNQESSSEGPETAKITNVNVWVTSERLILYREVGNVGITIPYPTISIHATQRLRVPGHSYGTDDDKSEALYMQLTLDDLEQTDPNQDIRVVELRLVQTVEQPLPSAKEDETLEQPNSDSPESAVQRLYSAISDCADLHPDPGSPLSGNDDDDDDDDDVQDEIPGAGGWITSENMAEYMDAEGNFTGFQILGAGAGTVRGRDEIDSNGEDAPSRNGNYATEETKWRRLD